MNEFTIPLDKAICDQVDPELYNTLIKLNPNTRVLDIRAFNKDRGWEPDVCSSFIVSTGGSYSDDVIETVNGSLVTYKGKNYGNNSYAYMKIMYHKQHQ